MTDSNTMNSSEEINKSKDTSNLYAKLVRDYSKNKLKDRNARSEYLKNLDEKDIVSDEIIEDIKKFAANDREWDYDGLTISSNEIEYGALRREAAWYLASLANNKRALKDVFLQEFDVPESELSSKIDTPLNDLSEVQIQDLHNSDRARKIFLQKHFWAHTLPKEKSIANFLREMTLEDHYKLVNPQDEINFHEVVQKIKSGRNLEDIDIETILSSWIYTQKQKQEFIQKLLPSVSIEQAKRFGLIQDSDAASIKAEQILSVDPRLSKWVVKEISSTISDQDVIIATNRLPDYDKNIDKIIENPSIFDGFVNSYNQTITSHREKIEWKEITSSEDFIDMLSWDVKVSGAQKLKQWAIIQISQTQKKSDGTIWNTVLFWEISKLWNDGSFEYIVKWNWDGKYDAAGSTKETIRYREFLNFVTNGNSEKWIMLNDMQVFWADEFDAKIASGDVEEYNGESLRLENIPESDHLWALLKKINELDSGGEKYGLSKWTVLKTKSGDIFTITQEPNKLAWEITLTSVWDHQTISFEDFYRAFKNQDTKRVSESPVDFGVMVENLQWAWDEKLSSWKHFSFSNNTIQKKESQKKIEYNYLGSKENNELIKIHDISGDRVRISYWELTAKSRTDKGKKLVRWDNNQIVKDETFSMENREYDVTLWYLQEYIKDNSLHPRWLNDNQEVSADTKWADPMKKNVHFWSAFFHNRATIADSIKWWKLFFEQMKEAFDMWSDEKANQFALKYMGSFITEDMRRDMQSRLEQKQKKSMDDYLDRLKTVASDVAIKMINKWLHDKYAPGYLHEAAVVFMLEKYGVLNAKWGLQKYEWDFIWYQALGWEIDDPFFKKIKSEKEDADLPFTEELLVYRLLKEQCRPNGFNGIKRRSKLHKEVKKHRATGKEEEYETGKRDGNDERTLQWRVDGGMGELFGNNYPNMVWWLEVAVNKWGPMDLMNKIPFVAAFSGVAYNFEEKVTDQLKNFPGGTRLLMMLRFFSHTSQLNLLNDTILAVCNKLEARWDPKHKWIAWKAQDIYNQMHDQWWWVEAKLKKTEIFYEQYGKDLTDILYMLNTWDTNDTHSKLIFFEKDGDDEDSRTLKKYYNTLHAFVDADTSFEDEWLMSDPFKWAGTSGIELHKWSEQQLGLRQGQFKKHTSWPMSWDEVQKELQAIPHRKYDSDPVKNKELQVKLLTDNLGRMMSGIMISVGTNARELSGYNTPTWPFNILNKWWVDMTRFEEASDFSVHGLAHPKEWTDTKRLVVEFANQIVEAETQGTNFSHKIVNDLWPNSNLDDVSNNVVSIAGSVNTAINKPKKKETNSYPSMNPLDDDYDLAA